MTHMFSHASGTVTIEISSPDTRHEGLDERCSLGRCTGCWVLGELGWGEERAGGVVRIVHILPLTLIGCIQIRSPGPTGATYTGQCPFPNVHIERSWIS